ncbi:MULTISPECIES: response regulator transcription factor [Fusobacterium]|uniref:Response regulator transcription factor n=1 Tax=Fusobacterium hominis TaxID=2764326 RepID=A0A7G9GWH9_9FUSO|nr:MULTISPECIES: response regulator transcription factor [Fusobacterium]QNM15161.1 response regulator transcription factor [Fusobacterium hominis]
MRILLVEDEIDLNNIISKYLKKNGYSVDSVFDGEEALYYLKSTIYDLIILDIMLPKIDGYQVAKTIRMEKNNVPILMLTAKDDIDDIVTGLDTADDYLVKPFDFKELLARIRALIRRKYGNTTNEISVKNVTLNTTDKSVKVDNKEVELTGKEYEILEYLLQNKGKVLSRDNIRDHVWNYDYEGESNLIDVLIKNIRKKISPEDSLSIIQTKRGLGYVIKD